MQVESAIDTLGVDNKSQMDELLAECYAHTEVFAKTFFPDVFFRPFAKMHRELCRVLDDDNIQKVAIAAPRGIGKTSLFNMAFPAKRILYRDSNYIIPISATADAAVEQADDLKDQLVENELIHAVFGPQQPEKSTDAFGQKAWVTRNGTKILPRGAGQQIRGKKHRSNRPDLFVIDDLEDDEAVESEDRREKLYRWLFSAVVNSVDRGSTDWRIILIGTILHEDAILSRLLKDPSWFTMRFEICNDQYESSWPEFISTTQVKKLAQEYRDQGLLEVFYREYRNIPIASEEQGFRPDMFIDYTTLDKDDPRYMTEEQLNRSPDVETVILSDPARTMRKGSANTAIVAVAIHRRTGLLYIRDVIEGQFDPNSMIEAMLDMAENTNALVLAPEVTGLNQYVTWPLENAMLRRGKHYVLVEVKPRESKTGPKRSGGLVPLYRQGMVLHNGPVCGGLEKYLMQWPRPEKWDVIDAVAGIIYAMEDGERFLGLIQDLDPAAIEAEYEELEYDPDELKPLYAGVL
jgi:hypothetical protein